MRLSEIDHGDTLANRLLIRFTAAGCRAGRFLIVKL
jgi:hypothetical protein